MADGTMAMLVPATPDEVLKMARHYEVDWMKHPSLLWLVKDSIETPLPPEWQELEDDEGNPYYWNTVTNVSTYKHPADDYYETLIGAVVEQMEQQLAAEEAEGDDVRSERSEHDDAAAHGSLERSSAVGEAATAPEVSEEAAEPFIRDAEGMAGESGAEDDSLWLPFLDIEGKPFYFDFRHRERSMEAPAKLVDRPSLSSIDPAVVRGRAAGGGSGEAGMGGDSGSDAGRATPLAAFSASAMLPSTGRLEDLEVLQFKSWWVVAAGARSSVRKRYVTLLLDIASGNARCVMPGGKYSYTLSHLPDGGGGALQAWDLHVGAEVDVFGRRMTLMQASATTISWLTYHEKRLLRTEARLKKELRKFDPRFLSTLPPRRGGGKRPGQRSLRKLMDAVEVLHRKLHEYRPSLADSITRS
eukprot:PLAT8815.1.p1 GENE.PLAT8815.1~~PLAT8815.1.p1  ORF type:complete len:414 (-),score=146.69 PLAT8815.1:112-1353(-)